MDIYTRYGPALLRKCERMLGSRADAEDIVQSLFIDLLRKGRTDVGLAYLYQAATRRCLNLMRNNRRHEQLLAEHGDVLVPHQTSLDEQVIGAQIVRRLVGQFDPLTAEIVVYAYLDRMSQDEISTIVGLSRKTVGKRLAQARRAATALAEGPA